MNPITPISEISSEKVSENDLDGRPASQNGREAQNKAQNKQHI